MLRRLTFHRATLAVTLLLVFAIGVTPAIDHDLWWHLRSGQWMVQHHAVLRGDPFSYTRAGAIRQPSDWLGELALYGTWSLGGLTAVALLVASMATAGMALVLAASKGPTLVRAAVVALAAAASTVFWTARPQMFTFLFTALVVFVLSHLRRGSRTADRALWLLVPLFALWSNLHLGWFYGLGVLWAAVLGELVDRARGRSSLSPRTWRALAAVTALSSVAVLLNPVGPRLYGLILTQVNLGRRFIQENQPPRLTDGSTLPFFLLLALTVLVLALRWRHVATTEVLLVAGTAVAALNAVRTISLFATVAAPVLTHHAGALLEARRKADQAEQEGRRPQLAQLPVVNGALVVAVAAVAVLTSAQRLAPANVDAALRREFPVAAVAWIRTSRPAGPMYNTFDWGGYLIWKLPEYPVSIDGRADLYDEELPVYDRTRRGEGWQEEFARQGVRLALLDTGGPLTKAVAADREWEVAYQDERATVLVKRTG